MLRSAHALARWLLGVLGAMALVTSVAGAVPDGCGEGSAESCFAIDGSASADLALPADLPGESSEEERDDDERDEEDPTDSEEAALRRVELGLRAASACVTTPSSLGARITSGSDRAAHRSTVERPPHA